jgi:hypothetical protein
MKHGDDIAMLMVRSGRSRRVRADRGRGGWRAGALRRNRGRYAGGYFWWYAAEDALHPGALLGKDLRAAFRSEAAVLG